MPDQGVSVTYERVGAGDAVTKGRLPIDDTVIEQLAGITDAQGYSVLGELLNAFLGAVPGRLDALDRAVSAGDLRVMADEAHALTGSAASFGARGMADLCRELRAAAEQSDLDAARPLVATLHVEFIEVRAWLVRFRSRA